MTESELFARIRTGMCARFNLPPESVTLETNLVDDLEFDSIDAIDLACDLEKLIGKNITEEEVTSITTIGDAVRIAAKYLCNSVH